MAARVSGVSRPRASTSRAGRPCACRSTSASKSTRRTSMRRDTARAALGLSLLLIALVALPGCQFVRVVGRGTGAFFSWPREVDKVRQPVQKDSRLSVLWVGHATALVQIDDKLILTDP